MDKSDELKAAIVCSHVASRQFPILHAVRDQPDEDADSGWQFLCGVRDHSTDKEAQVWALRNAVGNDLVLQQLVEEKPGTILTRRSIYAPWKIEYIEEQKDQS